MAGYEVELRERLKRATGQIEAQHKRLESLFEDLNRALSSGTGRDAQTAAFRLDGAVKAHFQLEEKIIFPAIRGLCPKNDSEFETLIADHHGLGVELQAVIDQILKAQFDLAAQALEKCWIANRDHRLREEAVLNALDSAASERSI